MVSMHLEHTATCHEGVLYEDGLPVEPLSPKGEGWRLVAAIPHKFAATQTLGVVWYWERKVPKKRRSRPAGKK